MLPGPRKQNDLPLNPALLPPTPIAHLFAYFAPEDIVIKIFALINSHLRDDACKFFLFLFLPLS